MSFRVKLALLIALALFAIAHVAGVSMLAGTSDATVTKTNMAPQLGD